ncbi:MAG: endonuclease domain-containing protein [Candidatus Harrisonbacteria bacterium]|nr:endonuclease domain-containing protein [Candidatus Harrisonbacteria bacterium]MBI2406656.1 endonuclease domain-containing protein [Candidatus Harrisonbacteria bacterium]MBI2604065.1 endonuclease domain-containing protein [Candidatus Harrisonbacteria bacterium]
MKLHYKNRLNSFARKLRCSGNLSEVFFWNELKSDKLGYRFLRQRPIGKYIVDFYCHALNLAIEIDGAASHDNKIEADEARQMALESLGVRVMRFRDADVRYNLESVVRAVQSEILQIAKIPRLSGTPFKKGGKSSVLRTPPLGKEEKSPAFQAPPLRKGE